MNSMKNTFLCLSVVLILFLLIANIATSAELKIGIFDIQQIIRESAKVQSYRDELAKDIEPKRTALIDKENSIKQLDQKLKTAQNLSPEEKKTLQDRIATDLRDYTRFKEDIDSDIKKKDRELTQQVINEIGKIISDFATKNNYSVVFERSAAGVIHIHPSIDITKTIIQLYDKK